MGRLFPVLDTDLTMTPAGGGQTLMTLNGAYRPPLAGIGAGLDLVVLHRAGDGDHPVAADPHRPSPRAHSRVSARRRAATAARHRPAERGLTQRSSIPTRVPARDLSP